MSARPSLFKETDVARAIRATRTAGLDIGRVEISKDGKIAIIPREPGADEGQKPSGWGEAIAKRS